MNFLIGLVFISALIGIYQTIYVLNKHLQSKIKNKKIEENESSCGETGVCAFPSKIESLKKHVELSLPESIFETSAGGKIEKVEDTSNGNG